MKQAYCKSQKISEQNIVGIVRYFFPYLMIFRDIIFMKIFVKLISRKNLLFLLFEMSLHLAHIVHHRSGNYLGGRLFLCLFWTQHIWRLILLENLFVPLKRFWIILYLYNILKKHLAKINDVVPINNMVGSNIIAQTNIFKMLSI